MCVVSSREMLPLLVINVTEKAQVVAKTLARCKKNHEMAHFEEIKRSSICFKNERKLCMYII